VKMVKNGKDGIKLTMAEEIRDATFYAGEFNKQLDEKRRVTIPSKWRFRGDEADNSYLAIPTVYGSISVLPPTMMAELHAKISKISMANPEKRRALSKFMSQSCTFGCDKQGRVMLGEAILKRAGVKKDVRMVGMGSTFEIWDPETRDAWLGESASEDDAALLEELGL